MNTSIITSLNQSISILLPLIYTLFFKPIYQTLTTTPLHPLSKIDNHMKINIIALENTRNSHIEFVHNIQTINIYQKMHTHTSTKKFSIVLKSHLLEIFKI